MTAKLTMDDVAQHGPSAARQYIAVDGEVFDVTDFLKFHPGGKQILLQACGTDASDQFNLYHHDGVLRKFREKLKVGEVLNWEKTQVAVPFAQPIHFSRFTSPYYKETHYKFAKRVQRFMQEDLLPSMDQWSGDARPPKDLYQKMGREGFLACLTGANEFPRQWVDEGTLEPEDYDMFHEFILLDLLAQCADEAVLAALTNGPAIALTCVMKFGTLQQKQLVAKDVLMGRAFIALAMSEPNAGSDVAGLACQAVKRGGKFVINGVKKWITNASYADYIVTAVVTGPGSTAAAATSLLLVKTKAADSAGLSVRKIGLGDRAKIAGTSYLEFDNVLVDESMLVGQLNQGFKHLMTNLNHERIYLATICNRLARVCVEECFKFALKRRTFGKALIEHDVVSSLLAKCSSRVEQQHSWLESIYFQLQSMSPSEVDTKLSDICCGAKAQSSEIFEECASASTHIFGGNALDSLSVGRRVQPMVNAVKSYTVPAGSAKIMELQMTKLAVKNAKMSRSKL
eukprot:TRINITY_DN41622_c0_g1_i1.p1 TRINITY_DN41622_c0_g1~~TRINITY_DN41622_c0_g1_i1.p1  ORF type:complete len:545 (-),score=98.88 TRINITY_DN41622_c0_g1_i1:102-1640(-)